MKKFLIIALLAFLPVFVHAQNVVVVVQTDGTEGATIDGETQQIIESGGDMTTVTAVAPLYYDFVNWTEDDVEVATTPQLRWQSVVTSHTFTANFVPYSTYTLSYTAGANGSISGDATQIVIRTTTGTAVTAVPDAGYSFEKWSDDSTDNPRIDGSVTESIEVTAYFTANDYTVSFDAQSGADPSPATKTVTFGEAYGELATTSRAGYTFTGWKTISGEFITASDTVSTPTDHTLYADWIINTYTLLYLSSDGGYVEGNTTQFVQHGSNATEVVATPEDGWKFLAWSDGVATAARTDSAIVASTVTTALFVKKMEMLDLSGNAVSGSTITEQSKARFRIRVSPSAATSITLERVSGDDTSTVPSITAWSAYPGVETVQDVELATALERYDYSDKSSVWVVSDESGNTGSTTFTLVVQDFGVFFGNEICPLPYTVQNYDGGSSVTVFKLTNASYSKWIQITNKRDVNMEVTFNNSDVEYMRNIGGDFTITSGSTALFLNNDRIYFDSFTGFAAVSSDDEPSSFSIRGR